MVRSKQPKDDKTESLKKYGALNPHPQKVSEKMFSDSALEFFDPRDLVQVKYEMLRAVDQEGRSVKQASEAFGFSRPAFYRIHPIRCYVLVLNIRNAGQCETPEIFD